MRIGIDVGGTHTDAVLLDGDKILSTNKSLTTADVASGIMNALNTLIADAKVTESQITAVMIGTTQFTNAVVERKELSPVAAIRVALPSGDGLPPMVDWPEDIAQAVGRHTFLLHGGYLYDGWPVAQMIEQEIDELIEQLLAKDLKNIAIASSFSPMNPQPELDVADRIRRAIPDARITLSHKIGSLGLLERENAAILNASLLPLADRVVEAFNNALKSHGLTCPMYISQNDGTLMNADFVKQFPALTFASGPTNSLRGACKLSGLTDAIVVDIGGTTSDIGILQDGFPRESHAVIDVGGVRTNFRMPDIKAVGLGGGSMVNHDGTSIGPRSVGHRLVEKGLIFGGDTLTSTDIAVALGQADFGEPEKVKHLDKALLENAKKTMLTMLDQNIDMMKPNSDPVPVILVGGGTILIESGLQTTSELIRPQNAGVANAIGAAIAQIGGEAEGMMNYRQTPREEVINQVTADAITRAVEAGADKNTIRTADIEETAIPYMDDGMTRVRVKVIGDIAQLSKQGATA